MKHLLIVIGLVLALLVGGCEGYHGGCVQEDNGGC